MEERRADYLARARESLEENQIFRCGAYSGDVPDRGHRHGRNPLLAGFCPRPRSWSHRRQEQLRTKLAQAQSLIGDAAYDEAIKFLEDALQQADDTALHMLLDQASAGRESLRQQIEAALASAVQPGSGRQAGRGSGVFEGAAAARPAFAARANLSGGARGRTHPRLSSGRWAERMRGWRATCRRAKR